MQNSLNRRVGVLGLRGQHDIEACAAPRRALDDDPSAMLLDNAVYDGEAEAGAFAGRLRREERLETRALVASSMPQPVSSTQKRTAPSPSRRNPTEILPCASPIA